MGDSALTFIWKMDLSYFEFEPNIVPVSAEPVCDGEDYYQDFPYASATIEKDFSLLDDEFLMLLKTFMTINSMNLILDIPPLHYRFPLFLAWWWRLLQKGKIMMI